MTFPSTHHALRAEELFKESKITVRLVPVPRWLSASCGLALRFAENDYDEVKKLLGNNQDDYIQLVMPKE